MMRRISNRRHGYTLLEMSIVIVIIALIVAGVLMSRALLRQAGLRAIVAENDQFVKATREFLDKYQALPGDMSNAESYWGSDTCPHSTYTSTVPTTSVTCNGDGNGRIGGCTFLLTDPLVCASSSEVFTAWQQLSIAGLIDGRYTGQPGGTFSLTQAKVGLNVPASKRIPGGWTLLHYINVTDKAWLKGDQYGHVLLFGGDQGGGGGKFTTQPILQVKETYELDLKIDDGFPETGILRGWDDYWAPVGDVGPTAGQGSNNCITAGHVYYSTSNEKYDACSLIFILGF